MPAPKVSPVTPPIRRRQRQPQQMLATATSRRAAGPNQRQTAAAKVTAVTVAMTSSVRPTKRVGDPTELGPSSSGGRA